jgi:hypothetical protein
LVYSPPLWKSQRGVPDAFFSGGYPDALGIFLATNRHFPRLDHCVTAQPFAAGDQFKEKNGSLS